MFEVETLTGLNQHTVYDVYVADRTHTYFLIYNENSGWEWVNANGFKPLN